MITPKYYPRSAESAGTVGTCTVGEAVFTHPRVGQAERLACRERQSNAFLRAEAHTHFTVRQLRTGTGPARRAGRKNDTLKQRKTN